MSFKIENLRISKEAIQTLIISIYPDEKAQIIGDVLKNMVIIKDDCLYICGENLLYSCHQMKKDKLLSIISLLIQKSYEDMSASDKKFIESTIKTYSSIFKNSTIETYLPQLKNRLECDNIKFDSYFNEIHFKNGFFDLKENIFKNRVIGKHFITKYITRNYEKSSEDDKEIIMSHINKIIKNDDDRKTVLMTIASALSGLSTSEQDLLILLGEGSAGKSFLLELTSITIQTYFKELKDDTFIQANSKIDKIMNSFANDPQIRISWINEPKDVKMDDSVIKTFCDGKLNTTKLYEDGSHTIQHFSKPIFTMNTFPSIKIDSGIARRLKGYEHKSKFVDDIKMVDEKNSIFLKDKLLLNKLSQNPNLLNAYFDILASYCHSWLKGEQIKYSKNFQDTKDTVLATNDHIQDFIDFQLKKTDSDKNRIGKSQMMSLYKSMYPNKYLSESQLITSLKSKGIQYSTDHRVNKIKGAFMFVRVNTELDELEDDLDNISYVGSSVSSELEPEKPSYESLFKRNEVLLESNSILITQNKILVEKLKELEQQLKQYDSGKIEIKPKQNNIQVVDSKALFDTAIDKTPEELDEIITQLF